MCEFHDAGYAIRNDIEVMKTLYEYIEGSTDALYCVGFNIPLRFEIPRNVKINNDNSKSKNEYFRFKHPVYFAHAIFHKGVKFENTIFDDLASFYDAHFKEQVELLSTNFRQGVDFSRARFYEDVHLRGTPKSLKSEEQDEIPEKRTTFEGYTNFYLAKFEKDAYFSGVEFPNWCLM
jgi:hypothetical protein